MAQTLRRSKSKYGRTRRRQRQQKKQTHMRGGLSFADFSFTDLFRPKDKCKAAKDDVEQNCNKPISTTDGETGSGMGTASSGMGTVSSGMGTASSGMGTVSSSTSIPGDTVPIPDDDAASIPGDQYGGAKKSKKKNKKRSQSRRKKLKSRKHKK